MTKLIRHTSCLANCTSERKRKTKKKTLLSRSNLETTIGTVAACGAQTPNHLTEYQNITNLPPPSIWECLLHHPTTNVL